MTISKNGTLSIDVIKESLTKITEQHKRIGKIETPKGLPEEIIEEVKKVYLKLLESTKHHLNGESIISSFDESGKIIKYEDSANILAFSHINYDEDLLQTFKIEYIRSTCDELLKYFRDKYNDQDINLIGRYKEDQYYNGQIWIICSLALAQVYMKLYIQYKYFICQAKIC